MRNECHTSDTLPKHRHIDPPVPTIWLYLTDTPGKSPKGLGSSKVLKKMDVFTKVHDDFRVRLACP